MENIREEIRKETAFSVFHTFNITDQAQCGSVSNTSDYSVQSDCLKFIHERLHADPVIAKEHHSLFSALMGYVDHFLRQLCNFSSLESLEITELF